MVSPREVKMWSSWCHRAAQQCRTSANLYMKMDQVGKASWYLFGVQIFENLSGILSAAQDYVPLLEEWSKLDDDQLFVGMCHFIADSVPDHEHYVYMILHKLADHYPSDPGDEQPEEPTVVKKDWVNQVFADAVQGLQDRLNHYAEGCGCNSCRADAANLTSWVRKATS